MLIVIDQSLIFALNVNPMYIVVIAWLYVVVLMAFTESSITAGVLTFFFFGLAPCLLLLWLFGGPSRKRHKLLRARTKAQSMTDENVNEQDRPHSQTDQRKLGE